MTTISKSTFNFLKELKQNNNRDWFMDNKPKYQEAKLEFEGFIDDLIASISKFDNSIGHHTGKECVFRIYRDVRFSKDKSPYKTHLGAHITSAAKKSEIHTRAGYYIHIGPGESMLAGGAYLPQGPWIKAIRQEIAYNADDLRKIINGKKFKEYFGEIEGEKLKRAPKGYEPDHPEIELLKYKSFLASNKVSDAEVVSKNFIQHGTDVFKTIFPFDQFLNRAMD